MHKIWRTELPVDRATAFGYHASNHALERLLPPWEPVSIRTPGAGIEPGSVVELEVRVAGVPWRYVARHTDYEPPQLFTDIQQRGPFRSWTHRHVFQAGASADRSQLIDDVHFELPAGAAGRLVAGRLIERRLRAMFAFRHRRTRADLQLLSDHPAIRGARVAVSGSSGLVGSDLTGLLAATGAEVVRLVRGRSAAVDEVAPWTAPDETERLNGFDAVVHLAGKPIAAKRWNNRVRQEIRDSRVESTRQLCEQLARLEHPPKVLVCASAIGIYGDRGEAPLDEASALGDDYLADVAGQWEDACQRAREAGVRVVNARFGMILSPRSGALQPLLWPAKAGVAGPVGGGQQFWSWIALDDATRAIVHAIFETRVRGPVDVVAPSPERNRDFMSTLGRVLHRPSFVPAPAPLLRVALGKMADPLLLASCRVVPQVLTETGFSYLYPQLDAALRHLLGRDLGVDEETLSDG